MRHRPSVFRTWPHLFWEEVYQSVRGSALSHLHTYANLRILSQLLVSGVGLSSGDAIDLTEKEDMELENNRQREEEKPPEPFVLVTHTTHEAVSVIFFRRLCTFRFVLAFSTSTSRNLFVPPVDRTNHALSKICQLLRAKCFGFC